MTNTRDEFEVVSLLDMQPPYVEYLRGIDVYVLRHRETGERRFAAFRSGRHLQAESAAIQRLQEEGKQVIPDDADSLVPEPFDVRPFLDVSIASVTQNVVERDRELSDIEQVISAKEAARSTTQDARERQELEDEIRRLKEDLTRAQGEREAAVSQIQLSMDNAPAFLRTEEHRPLLKRALQEAKREVIVISPWMNLRAVDHELCTLIGDALRRGVRLRIGYGIGQNNPGSDAERKRRNARDVISKIEKYAGDAPKELLDIANVLETHEKILICDNSFGVMGSFNWLSYRGDIDEGYRRETGVLLKDRESVQRLIQTATEAFIAVTPGPA